VPPPVNQELYDETLAYLARCYPDDRDPQALAEYYSRSLRHEYVDIMKCIGANGCVSGPSCPVVAGLGTVGDVICARQRACGNRCHKVLDDDDAAGLLNDGEAGFRPALVAELRRCANESDCDVAMACWEALQPTVYFVCYPEM
jgi:hypothetical protein